MDEIDIKNRIDNTLRELRTSARETSIGPDFRVKIEGQAKITGSWG